MSAVLLTASHGQEAVPGILLALAFVLVGAKLFGELVERLGLPAVLGELALGIILANLVLVRGPDIKPFLQSETFTVLAELGAILLLFQAGLESTTAEMRNIGARAALVAVVGVIAPMALGYGVGALMRPQESWMVHAFLGALLTATSVGITARVLGDAGALGTPFARIILGAAVIDDVLGLLVLAVVSGVITGAASGTGLGVAAVALIVAKAFAFLVGALVVGSFLSPRVFRTALKLRSTGVVQAVALSFCFLLSYAAILAGLAPIVGAFAAGLILEDVHVEAHVERGDRSLHDTMAPLVALLVPVFFVRMGMLVDLRSFAVPSVLAFAVLLALAAVVGKLACGLVVPPELHPRTIALGMIPRGEVGLIVAAIGAGLMLNGRPVIDSATYAAAVFVVVSTTLVTPPLLLWSIRKDARTRTA